jgi:tripartite-type tricarboxylate transporter receptor subunit TctC
MKRTFLKAALGAVGLAIAGPSFAQAPGTSRPLRVLVGFAPGGAADLAARVMAEALSQRLGQAVVIENRPGAGGIVAAQAVSKAEPDGATVLFGSMAMSVQLALDPSMKFDPLRELAPIGLISEAANVLEVPADSPVRTVRQLVEHGKGRSLSFGSSGIGTSLHLSGEMLKHATRSDMVHVPYKGSAPALTDLVAGRVDFMFDSLASSMPFIKAGKLRALAVTSRTRSAHLPDVPTMAEAGFPDIETSVWFGLFAPAGTPAPAVNRMAGAITASLQDPQVMRRLSDLSMDIAKSDAPEKFGEFFARDVQRWKDTLARVNVSVRN